MPIEEKALTEFAEAVKAFRSHSEEANKRFDVFGQRVQETTEKMVNLGGRLDEMESKFAKTLLADRWEAEQKAMAAVIDDLNTRLSRIGQESGGAGKKDKSVHQGAWEKALKYRIAEVTALAAHPGFSDEERKALILGNDAAGGYLAPNEFVRELYNVNIREMSPVREFCTVRSTSAHAVVIPTKRGGGSARWIGETEQRTETLNQTFGTQTIPLHEQSAKVPVSLQQMEDSAFDMEAILREDFAFEMGAAEAVAFLTGDGVGKPKGMLTDSNVAIIASGASGALTADAILKMTFSLKQVYMANPAWMFNRLTAWKIRTLKDAENRYLWNPSLDQLDRRVGPTVLGYRYGIAVDMADVSAGNDVILFGDFKRAYTVVDRLGLQVLADPYSKKDYGMVEFSARRRVGGQLIVPEAICKMRIDS